MIQHLVAFRFDGETIAERGAQAALAAQYLSPMAGRVPGLLSLDIRRDLGTDSGHWDLMLISRHLSLEALSIYIGHPLHVAAKASIDEMIQDRAIVDSDLEVASLVEQGELR